MNDADDEQASITIANIKNCIRLEKETDKIFKLLPKNPLCDTETLNILKGTSTEFIDNKYILLLTNRFLLSLQIGGMLKKWNKKLTKRGRNWKAM